jgi:hypothetical protein
MSKFSLELDPANSARNDIMLSFNGEIAFSVTIENDPETGVSAKATIWTWPIEGGEGESATVNLRATR